MRINENVYLFEKIRGANSYLYISDDNDVSIIDTGMPGNAEKILSQILKIGISIEKIKYIILTHSDIDHMGSVADLKNITGAKVAIHENEAPYLLGEKNKKRKGIIGLIFGILFKFIKTQNIAPDIILKEGDFIGGLRVVSSPGHTVGSISLYNAGTVLFSGDAIITDRHSNIKGFNTIATADLFEAAKTISKIKHLEFEVLLPGHGKPVLEKASDKLKKYNKI
ncbi:MBL fold metallo-hydrolase [Segatella paludivivens]|uniref:MBL fold metallo-hydrolase n=1 Tax=Segatella paludivivens TaxID=185294 RepID=UPI000361F1AC|nr:MBL fold metallo-hydrolase [Segatella paludivivens]